MRRLGLAALYSAFGLFAAYLMAQITMRSISPSVSLLITSGAGFLFFGAATLWVAIRNQFDFQTYMLFSRRGFLALLHPFLFMAAFAVLSRDLCVLYPDQFSATSTSLISDPNVWVMFALDQTARATLLDLFETFKWSISPIDYQSGLVVPSVVFLYKTLMSGSFWMYIIKLARSPF